MLGERVAIKEFFVKDFCNRDEATAHVTVGTQSKKGLVDKLKHKFVEEAKMLYRMQHSGIVRVFDIFEENGTAYFVMDYINGPSLSEIVNKEGPLNEARAIKYIRQIAEALKYVHERDRLHLDIKPGNIMINQEDQAILIDFGASKQYDEQDGENTSTLLGTTPGYAPLEQMGNDVVKFMPATDIYALGATLYKLLTGITPLSANLLASGEELEPLPNGISEATRKVIIEAMRINKNKRTQSVAEFLALLGGETKDTHVSQSSKPQTQPIQEKVTKLTDEEETLVIGASRENTQLDKEKKETPREPSATLVESKTWKELFKERHPIVNFMMMVAILISLVGIMVLVPLTTMRYISLGCDVYDLDYFWSITYMIPLCILTLIGFIQLLKHKQKGFWFIALSVPLANFLQPLSVIMVYNEHYQRFLVGFFYYLFIWVVAPLLGILVSYGILHVKYKGYSAWSLMETPPIWMIRTTWLAWIIFGIAIFAVFP